ncbi:galactosyl transferase GMA12/MNN10 family-domain-containing protein [Scheffersomyces xylosifermentans]|uniref:galactosyl transferase GMA12/MNN10 family-domain-containing protein n=1 Tax=Scheffersomyces xylosifermentans TaxID=1304137 RepID=UPI00315D1CD0
MLGTSHPFKPKFGGNKKQFLPLPATFSRIQKFQRKNLVYIIVTVVVIYLFFNPISALSGWIHSSSVHKYPPPHPLTSKNEIITTSKYIYPPIEHAPLLKELTVHKLVKETRVRDPNFPEVEKTLIRSLNVFDDPNPLLQKQIEDEENAVSDLDKAKNFFKNQDKVVFRPNSLKNYPEVIIVSAVDFQKYTLDGLTKIVQNRVDYAHSQNYGVYVRWYQEFLPILNSLSYLQIKEKAKWVRLYCMRAAMHAFPHAKWFWYIDEDGLIMDLNINIQQYILDEDALNPIMQHEVPIIPPGGAIKTYKNARADSIKLIITQSDQKVETHSFLMKNDPVGRAILDIWGDALYLTYPNFPYGPDSALTHILQWHPFILSKTTIIPARTISAAHTNAEGLDPKADKYHYFKGDFIVQWGECETPKACEKVLDKYHPFIEKKN